MYIWVNFFAASLEVIIIETLYKVFEFTRGWLQFGYTNLSGDSQDSPVSERVYAFNSLTRVDFLQTRR